MKQKEEREPQCTVIVGKPGSGKTTYTLEIIQTLSKGKGVLIFDINNEKKYKIFPRLELDRIKSWDGQGIWRIFDDDFPLVFETLYRYAYTCGIVFEDATSYISGNVNAWINKFLINRRHHGVDIVFTFHSLNRVPPIVYEMSNYLVLGKTNDTERNLQQLSKLPNPEQALQIWRRVQAHRNPYFRISIKTNA